jgi:hypothetical protein
LEILVKIYNGYLFVAWLPGAYMFSPLEAGSKGGHSNAFESLDQYGREHYSIEM